MTTDQGNGLPSKALLITLSGAVVAAGLVSGRPLASANDRSRWATVYALVHQRTFRIDEVIRYPGWDTIDKVRHEGHFYSTKPALLPVLAAGVYWCVWRTTGLNLLNHTPWAAGIVLVCVNLLPMLAALWVLSRLLERYAAGEFTRWFVLATAALGTFLTTFSLTFNNHTVAAWSVLAAVYAALRITADGSRCPGHFVSAGFFAAFACANELPAALFGLSLFGLLARADLKRTLWCFVPAALVPLAAFFFTTYLQTGGWKPFYMYYGTEKYRYVIDGVPSYWMEPKGIDRNLDSPLAYLVHCTVGHHGIFSLSPVMLFSLACWLTLRQWTFSPLRPFLWMGLLLTIALLAFYGMRTENYNYGGVTSGLRWTFWLIPLWLVALIPVLDAWGRRRTVQTAALACLAVSAFSAMWPFPNPWQHPWLFVLMQDHWRWIDYRDPPPTLDRSLHSWFGSLPETPADSALYPWIELAGYEVDGTPLRLRLSDAGTVLHDGRVLRRIEFRWIPAGSAPRTYAVHIDAARFAAGRPPEDFLVWLDRAPASADQAAAIALVRGIPGASSGYVPRRVQYLKTPLRKDAYRCVRATAWGAAPADDAGRLGRCDVWLSDEVPFGVVQVETAVVHPRSGEIIACRRLTIVAAGQKPK